VTSDCVLILQRITKQEEYIPLTSGSYQRVVLVYLLLLAVVHITFAAFPRIDLVVSAWFAQAQG